MQSSGDCLLQLRLSAAFAAGKPGSPQPQGALLVSDAQCTIGRAVLAMDPNARQPVPRIWKRSCPAPGEALESAPPPATHAIRRMHSARALKEDLNAPLDWQGEASLLAWGTERAGPGRRGPFSLPGRSEGTNDRPDGVQPSRSGCVRALSCGHRGIDQVTAVGTRCSGRNIVPSAAGGGPRWSGRFRDRTKPPVNCQTSVKPYS